MAQTDQIVLLQEVDLNQLTFSEVELEEYAEHIGIDLEHDRDLFWIAEAGLREPLPPNWVPAEAVGEGIFYFNKVTRDSVWEHPADDKFKLLVKKTVAERQAIPLTLVALQEGEAFRVEAWNLAGCRLAQVVVRHPDETHFADLRAKLLAQVEVPKGAVVRMLSSDATMLGHSFESLLVADVFGAPESL